MFANISGRLSLEANSNITNGYIVPSICSTSDELCRCAGFIKCPFESVLKSIFTQRLITVCVMSLQTVSKVIQEYLAYDIRIRCS